MILVYIISKNQSEAKKIATHLLTLRLISCANILPISSLYRWKGTIRSSKECALLCKTKNSHYLAIAREVEAIHSYKIPCILKLPANANPKYLSWLRSCVK